MHLHGNQEAPVGQYRMCAKSIVSLQRHSQREMTCVALCYTFGDPQDEHTDVIARSTFLQGQSPLEETIRYLLRRYLTLFYHLTKCAWDIEDRGRARSSPL